MTSGKMALHLPSDLLLTIEFQYHNERKGGHCINAAHSAPLTLSRGSLTHDRIDHSQVAFDSPGPHQPVVHVILSQLYRCRVSTRLIGLICRCPDLLVRPFDAFSRSLDSFKHSLDD